MGKQLTNQQFIERSKQVHGEDAFIYDELTDYKGHREPVTVKCAKCGRYITVKANNHLNGHGCPYCNKRKSIYNTESFKEVTRKIHNNKYDDSELIYRGPAKKVKLICNKIDEKTGQVHGPFWLQARHYLAGCGCAKCLGKYFIKQLPDEEKPDGRKSRVFTTMPFDKFVEKAQRTHGNTYTYFEDEYESYYKPAKMQCKNGHEFYQRPYKHVSGDGCPYCVQSRFEESIDRWLNENNIKHERQYKFKELGNLRFDFFLEELNLLIECQGEQHFYSTDFF